MYTLDTSPLRIVRQTLDSCFSIHCSEKLCMLVGWSVTESKAISYQKSVVVVVQGWYVA